MIKIILSHYGSNGAYDTQEIEFDASTQEEVLQIIQEIENKRLDWNEHHKVISVSEISEDIYNARGMATNLDKVLIDNIEVSILPELKQLY